MIVQSHSFTVYAITSLVLCANLIFLWAYSGATRGRTRTAINPEDGERFGASLVDADPPAVARALRAHRNAEATIYPFLILGLVFVMAGGGGRTATILFGIFTVSRLLHSAFYLAGKQPWRTVSFLVGGLALLALMAIDVWLLL